MNFVRINNLVLHSDSISMQFFDMFVKVFSSISENFLANKKSNEKLEDIK